MKLLAVKTEHGKTFGFSIDDKNILLIEDVSKYLNIDLPVDIMDFIKNYGNLLNTKINNIFSKLSDKYISLENVNILPPIEVPRRNVFCVGKNYVEHANEISRHINSSEDLPKEPIFFSKACDVIKGDGDSIFIQKELGKRLDYEAELVVIIGKDGCNISEEEVENYIFGYSVGNDLSARDIQAQRGQWFKGKSLDNSTIIGPAILTKESIHYPPKLNISAYVNNEKRQDSNTENFIFNLDKIISDLSQGLTLRAGDMIMTGTPSGVGIAMNPKGLLKNNDIVECRIECIGSIINRIQVR